MRTSFYLKSNDKMRWLQTRGGQKTRFGSRNFKRPQSARAMYLTTKFIKSKFRSVFTDEHLAQLVRRALTTYQPNF